MKANKKILSVAAAAGLLFGGCNAEQQPVKAVTHPAPVNLIGTQWSLEDLAGIPAIANSRATLTFPDGGKVSGNGSCNRFTGPAQMSGDAIKIGPLAATRMMCEAEVSGQETEYLKALDGVRYFSVKDGKLYLYGSGSEKPLIFHPAS